MPYGYKKLKERITEVFGTQVRFAKAICRSKNSVSNKLNGKTEISQSDVEQWAKVLNIERCEYGDFFYT